MGTWPGWEFGPMGTWVGVPGPLPWLDPWGLPCPVFIAIPPEDDAGMGPPPIIGTLPAIEVMGLPIGPMAIGPLGP